LKAYGRELIIDMHQCNISRFDRKTIEAFFTEVCDRTDMEKCELFWWDDLESEEEEKQTDPQTTGTTAVQFILTSNITIHTLDKLGKVFINFFSCKDFNTQLVKSLALFYFGGTIVNELVIERK
jgi:S-adenosylmethionine/arginine decarboxylase-like enzyme